MNESEYYKSLDEALLSLNVEKLKAHAKKYGIDFQPRNEEAWEVALHKAITGRRVLPREIRIASRKFLLERGFKSWDDGDLGGAA